MQKPEISVIIPVYNAREYLNDCIESILKQDFDRYEVIMVDDGSTDDSPKICKEFCVKDSRYRLIEQSNCGPDMARKRGVSEAEGRFIAFVDSDDRLADGILKLLYETALTDRSDIVCSQIARFDAKGRIWTDYKGNITHRILDNTKDIMQSYFADRLLVGSYCAKLIDRKLIDGYDGADSSLIGEDIRANLFMLEKADRVTVISDIGYYYRWNISSISHSGYTDRHRLALNNYIRIRDEYLTKDYINRDLVSGYFAEYEMAVATAMSRNKTFDKETARMLREDIAKHWKEISNNPRTALYMKASIFIYLISPRLFIGLYMIFYYFTGR